MTASASLVSGFRGQDCARCKYQAKDTSILHYTIVDVIFVTIIPSFKETASLDLNAEFTLRATAEITTKKVAPPTQNERERVWAAWTEFLSEYKNHPLFQDSDYPTSARLKAFFLWSATTLHGSNNTLPALETLVHYIGVLKSANNSRSSYKISDEAAKDTRNVGSLGYTYYTYYTL